MSEKNEAKQIEIDTRTLERKLKSGEITEEEYKKYLDGLEECSDYDTIDENALIKEAGIKRNY
ncbi:hypothetical protein J6Z19_00970 [bacterium]|nr:hypothetical protein [bacterium]